ncbi:MAG: DASH family cryptochrome [Nitrincola lacisaponensis]|uniref:DASH family cryptochrome n=1 Tax=Nitrincola lacisaponensis TaxID=267850 RepID=UPI00391C5114
MKRTHLYWFTQDLRLDDHAALLRAAQCDRLLLVYCLDTDPAQPNRYGLQGMGPHRWRFLHQGLQDLQQQLKPLGQTLLVLQGSPVKQLSHLITEHQVHAVFSSEPAGTDEQRIWQTLQQKHDSVSFIQLNTYRLFEQEQLPFSLSALPETFSNFRKRVETLDLLPPLNPVTQLPPTAFQQSDDLPIPAPLPCDHENPFRGGATPGLQHLSDYFASQAPQTYKITRNALDTWEHSTKFSPWLAQGSLSVRRILSGLRQHEHSMGANESTYWIYFELLWREYFQWYALKHKQRLFNFSGLRSSRPLTSFYPQRFRAWCEGNTPYAAVNACMKQLKATGYLSNRGRQWVASCLVNELQLDWRYGAAYFEQQLLDYDVASNWGNWQYLAGVGADPRGLRHFNLHKQAQEYDPDGSFIQRWGGQAQTPYMDSVDAADWPILRH